MKRFLPGLIIGLVVGAVAVSLFHAFGGEVDADGDHDAVTTPAAGADADESATVANTVSLTAEQVAAAGLESAAPVATPYADEVVGYARLLTPAPLLALATELTANEAAWAAAQREVARLRKLHDAEQNVSTRELESAAVESTRLEAVVTAARDQLRWAWGAVLADPATLRPLLVRLRAGEIGLARVDLGAGVTLTDLPAEVTLLPGSADDQTITATVLGRAAQVDATLQGPALLVSVPGPAGTVAGATLRARVAVSAATQSGWSVPASALVRHEGFTWVFVVIDDHTFARRQVEVGPASAGRVVVTAGLAGGERVVTVGAQQLLSAGLSSTEEEE